MPAFKCIKLTNTTALIQFATFNRAGLDTKRQKISG